MANQLNFVWCFFNVITRTLVKLLGSFCNQSMVVLMLQFRKEWRCLISVSYLFLIKDDVQYCNVTEVGYWKKSSRNLQWNGFILHDIQGCVNWGILLASRLKKCRPLGQHHNCLYSNRIAHSNTEGYHLFSTTFNVNLKPTKLSFSYK